MEESALLNYADLHRLIELTAERARAAQEAADILARIHEGQREQSAVLADVKDALHEMISCTQRVEGISTAVAAYLSSRNGRELDSLRRVLETPDEDSGHPSHVSVHVEQQAGTQIDEVKAKARRDISLAGGDVKGGSG